MELTSLLGYILVGLLFGWISSTLVEWVWYRGRHRRIDLATAPSGMRVSQPLPGVPAGHSYGAPELSARPASDQEASAADATPQKGRRARKNARPGRPAEQAPQTGRTTSPPSTASAIFTNGASIRSASLPGISSPASMPKRCNRLPGRSRAATPAPGPNRPGSWPRPTTGSAPSTMDLCPKT